MTRTHLIVLRSMFFLRGCAVPVDLCRLAQHARLPLGQVRRALVRLERDGLARAATCSLTLQGLAVVVGAGALARARMPQAA